jgi:hypothetical protein
VKWYEPDLLFSSLHAWEAHPVKKENLPTTKALLCSWRKAGENLFVSVGGEKAWGGWRMTEEVEGSVDRTEEGRN